MISGAAGENSSAAVGTVRGGNQGWVGGLTLDVGRDWDRGPGRYSRGAPSGTWASYSYVGSYRAGTLL